MLKPSCTELMKTLNNESDMEKITSNYAVVIAVAKRARQIIDGDDGKVGAPTDKAVSIAVREMEQGYIQAYPDEASIVKDELPEFDKGLYKAIEEALKNEDVISE